MSDILIHRVHLHVNAVNLYQTAYRNADFRLKKFEPIKFLAFRFSRLIIFNQFLPVHKIINNYIFVDFSNMISAMLSIVISQNIMQITYNKLKEL